MVKWYINIGDDRRIGKFIAAARLRSYNSWRNNWKRLASKSLTITITIKVERVDVVVKTVFNNAIRKTIGKQTQKSSKKTISLSIGNRLLFNRIMESVTRVGKS